MNIADVSQLTPTERFLYWINERHDIYLKRKRGKKAPWTDDKVLQSNFFTNPYRENDKVTVWFRENIREPLRNDPRVLMATIIFRWFNLPSTGYELMNWPSVKHWPGFLGKWNKDKVITLLTSRASVGEKIFTGAYMIKSPPAISKIEGVCNYIDKVWKEKDNLLGDIEGAEGQDTLENMHGLLTRYEGLGGFMAYEVVTDLRHTMFLENASDINTWCNPGPGCRRGLHRLNGINPSKSGNSGCPPLPEDWLERMQELLKKVRSSSPRHRKFEMREIEHSLCEYDKYERVLFKQGKSKRKYDGLGK